MPPIKNYDHLIGQKFNKLIVIASLGIHDNRRLMQVKCECGRILTVRVEAIGVQKSCPHCRQPSDKIYKFKHEKGEKCPAYVDGRTKEKLHNVWNSIKSRINNPNCKGYKWYGAKGIKLCHEWYDYLVFKKWAIENGYKEGLTIERVDNNKNYDPQNCSWDTRKKQSLNKSNSRLIEYNGEKKTVKEWCDILGLKYSKERSKVYYNFNKTGCFKLSVA